jgi:serine protease AprX
VLVKCGSSARIAHDDIRRGLDWVLRHRKRYGIRVVNVSCGGDYEASYLIDALSQAAEDATRSGILVCAAVGNLGHAPRHPVLPPASAPSVLTVGGWTTRTAWPRGLRPLPLELRPHRGRPAEARGHRARHLGGGAHPPRHHHRGPGRADPAPARGADAELRDHRRPARRGSRPRRGGRPRSARLRELIAAKIKGQNLITAAYKHVDGTSFAAPIVTSVAAQMLERTPRSRRRK